FSPYLCAVPLPTTADTLSLHDALPICWKLVPNAKVAKNHPDWYWGMGLTAEAVAKEFKVSREDQDKFAYESHQRAIRAIETGRRSEEHTSELQSREKLVCRLLLEKKQP